MTNNRGQNGHKRKLRVHSLVEWGSGLGKNGVIAPFGDKIKQWVVSI